MEQIKLLSLIFMFALVGCHNMTIEKSLDSKLPALFITIPNEQLDSITYNRNYKTSAYALLLTSTGDTILEDSLEHIKTRGNSTIKAEKKAYSIKLKRKMRLLGLDKGKRFALLANAFDESHIRNAVALDLASEIGLLAPHYTYLSLYINSDYKGLYQITNKVEENPEFVKGSGFLIEQFRVSQDTFDVVLPRHSSKYERDSIKRLYGNIRCSIMDSTESIEGLSKMIDVHSFVRYYLLQEITHNMDAGVGSFYLYCTEDTLLHAGPAWDFDLSLCTGWQPYEWTKDEIIACAQIDSAGQMASGILLHYLWNNKRYKELVRKVYNEEISGICHSYLESGKMDSLIAVLQPEVEMDVVRNGKKGNDSKNYEAATNRVRLFLKQRIDFLDWYFGTRPNEKVCITYRDTWFGWWERTVQIWLPSNRPISVPKLIYEVPFNNSPIPFALYYSGTDSLVSSNDIITSDKALELKWRTPNWYEFQYRRIKKKLRSMNVL